MKKLNKVADIKKRSKKAKEKWLAIKNSPYYREGKSPHLSARKPSLAEIEGDEK